MATTKKILGEHGISLSLLLVRMRVSKIYASCHVPLDILRLQLDIAAISIAVKFGHGVVPFLVQ